MMRPSSPPVELPAPVYRRLAATLRIGLSIALGILAGSLAVLLARAPASPAVGWITTNALLPYLALGSLASGLAHGAPAAYLSLGVYALIATPVVRVAAGFYSFRHQGERGMAAIAAGVLALLLFGLLVVGPLVR